MHGAKLSREAVIGGLSVWRPHLAVFATTYVLFPILGVALTLLPDGLFDPEIKMGRMFLCILPSPVQSSIAFTSLARRNLPAPVCRASLSNLSGVFFAPLHSEYRREGKE